jgi:hypothetical protein
MTQRGIRNDSLLFSWLRPRGREKSALISRSLVAPMTITIARNAGGIGANLNDAPRSACLRAFMLHCGGTLPRAT